MGRRKQTVKPGPPSKPLPAQGGGSRKRTPSSSFDPAAGLETYEPEKIVGERKKNVGGGKWETQWEVKWAGHDKNHNTYEPIAHLAGCEDMIAEYNERKRQREQESWRPRSVRKNGRSRRRRMRSGGARLPPRGRGHGAGAGCEGVGKAG